MEKVIYDWKRYWVPRDGEINFDSKGYLQDPEDVGRLNRSHAYSFQEISDRNCLVLLGEPGSGKSFAVSSAHQEAVQAGCKTVYVDLRTTTSGERLVSEVFESKEFQEWRQGTDKLFLFIDSLDEGLLQVSNLAAVLTSQLRKCPVHRLALRIACRAAEWPPYFEDDLKELFPKSSVGVYELAPLTERDVRAAAVKWEVDANAFCAEVESSGSAPFAIKPLTLNFLLSEFLRTRTLPSNQIDIYRQGLLIFCEEVAERRPNVRPSGEISPSQRLKVAGRIAACTILANKAAVWTGVEDGSMPNEDVPTREIAQGVEQAGGNKFQVTEPVMQETLRTALFSHRSSSSLGWAHQSYGEFLAAWYLIEKKIPVSRIFELLTNPLDEKKKVIPQLREVAAWLARFDPEIMQQVIGSDPDVFLSGRIVPATAVEREGIVNGLLRQFEQGLSLNRAFSSQLQYKHLAHDKLVDQLEPFILNKDIDPVARREAIEIARECQERGLQDDFLRIILDETDAIGVRIKAAYVLVDIGDNSVKAALKPLAFGKAGEDPDDELKGIGLQAVWPNHLSANELFSILTPRKNDSFLGAYSVFIGHRLPEKLTPDIMPEALKWVEAQPSRHFSGFYFERLIDKIMVLGWGFLEEPGVIEPYARAVASRLKNHDEIGTAEEKQQFEERIFSEPEKRHALTRVLLPMLSEFELDAGLFAWGSIPIVTSRDFDWLIEQFESEGEEELREIWAKILSRAFDLRVPGQTETMLGICERHPLVKEKFQWAIGPTILDSPKAMEAKEFFELRQNLDQKQEEYQRRIASLPSLQEAIETILVRCETKDVWEFWVLTKWLARESPDERLLVHLNEPDLTETPGWKVIGEDVRARILRVAEEYVLKFDARPEEWFDTPQTYHLPAAAGYKALRLLLKENREFVEKLEPDIWQNWAPIILTHWDSESKNETDVNFLIQKVYENTPDVFIETVLTFVDIKNRTEEGAIWELSRIASCMDETLGRALLDKVKDTALKSAVFGQLLTLLVENQIVGAREYAEELVHGVTNGQPVPWERAVVAGRILLFVTPDAGWGVVWPAMCSNESYGKELFESRDSDSGGNILFQKLADQEIADLYLWLCKVFPRESDPSRSGYMGARHFVADLRDYALRVLVAAGNYSACIQLRRIAEERPDDTWMKYQLEFAEENARRQTWVPLAPKEILALSSPNQQEIPWSDVIEAKPNFVGFGIDLKLLWRKLFGKK